MGVREMKNNATLEQPRRTTCHHVSYLCRRIFIVFSGQRNVPTNYARSVLSTEVVQKNGYRTRFTHKIKDSYNVVCSTSDVTSRESMIRSCSQRGVHDYCAGDASLRSTYDCRLGRTYDDDSRTKDHGLSSQVTFHFTALDSWKEVHVVL